jgi:DNA-binding protein Fis
MRIDFEVAPTDKYKDIINKLDAQLLESMLDGVGNNQSTVAKYLKLNRGTLRKKMKIAGMIKPSIGIKL